MDLRRVLILQEAVPAYRVAFFNGLAERGFDVTVAHAEDRDTIDAARFRAIRLHAKRFAGVVHQTGVSALAKNHDVFIVPFNPRITAGFALASMVPERSIVWGHGMGRNGIANKLRLRLARRVASVALYHQGCVAPFVNSGIPTASLSVVPNTIRVNLGSDEDKRKRNQFLYVGRLQERKRLDALLGAFASVGHEFPGDVGITILGSGPIGDDLKAQASSSGISDRVTFLPGTTDENTLRETFATALAYVSPGHVGLGVLHSMAHGVPVITCRGRRHAPEFYDVTHDENGLVVPFDEYSLASAMLTVHNDPEKRNRMAASARLFYRSSRSMTAMVDAMARVINGVAAANKVENGIPIDRSAALHSAADKIQNPVLTD